MRVWVLELDTDHYEQRNVEVVGVFETLEKAKAVVLDTVASDPKWRGKDWQQGTNDETGLEEHAFYFDLVWYSDHNGSDSIDKNWGVYNITEMDVQ